MPAGGKIDQVIRVKQTVYCPEDVFFLILGMNKKVFFKRCQRLRPLISFAGGLLRAFKDSIDKLVVLVRKINDIRINLHLSEYAVQRGIKHRALNMSVKLQTLFKLGEAFVANSSALPSFPKQARNCSVILPNEAQDIRRIHAFSPSSCFPLRLLGA